MTRVGLRHVIGRDGEARALVSMFADTLGVAVSVEDRDGRLLHGEKRPEGTTRYPVQHGDDGLGWVAGPEPARAVAQLLDHLVAREVERKALGSEVLNLYREINLIYGFSERLAALLDVEKVGALTLQEARHLIVATDGVVMLLDEDSGDLTTVAGFGDELPALVGFRKGRGVLGAIAATGVAEIVNDVDADPRRVVEHTTVKALLGAALRVGERVTGVIALGSTLPMSYTAAELKLLNTLALQTATAIENARLFESTVQAARERERLLALHQEAELARAKLESELDLAARIQTNLFPSELPRVTGYELAARNRPARQCGGDYYDALEMTGEPGAPRLMLCVADVSGKGLPAALVMSNMQATLRALLGRFDSLPALADRANALLFGSTTPDKYVTAVLLALEPATGAFRYVSAGHVDTLVVRADGGIASLSSTGTPFGMLPPGLPYAETAGVVGPGDRLVLYSDGVTDAQNAADEEYGEDRLREALQRAGDASPETVIDEVFASIDAFAGGAPQFDDITMLVLRRR